MGTFHEGKHELHGTTIVVDTAGREVYVGRCEDLDARAVILVDADVHRDGDGGKSKDEYLARAAQIGVWKKYDRLVIPRQEVASIRTLGEI